MARLAKKPTTMLLCQGSEKGETMWDELWLCWREIHHIPGWEHWKAVMGWEAEKRKKNVLCNLSQTRRHLHPRAPSITLNTLAPFLLNTRKTSACWPYRNHAATPCKLSLTDAVVWRAGRAASRNTPSPAYSARLQHSLLAPVTHPLNIITSVLT